MKRKYAAISAITILVLAGCAKHTADQNTAKTSSAPQASSSTAPSHSSAPKSTEGGQPSKANLFNKQPGNPNLIPVSSGLQKPIPVSWYDLELMDLYMINQSGLSSQVSHDGLVMFFEPEKYGIAKKNVFDRKAIVKSAMEKYQSVLKQVPTDQPFTINTQFRFNPNYNFQGQYFPMKAFVKGSSFSFGMNSENSKDRYIYSNFDSNAKTLWPVNGFSVQFTNYKCIGNLDMPSGQAKTFLNSRTGQSGNIDDNLFAKVDFVITGYKKFGEATAQQIYFKDASLYAKLLRVTIYNNSQDASNGGKPIATYNCQ